MSKQDEQLLDDLSKLVDGGHITLEEAQAAFARQSMTHQPGPAAPALEAADVAKAAASVGRGAGTVFKRLLGMPVDLVNLALQGTKYQQPTGIPLPDLSGVKVRGGSDDVQSMLDITGLSKLPMYEPDTPTMKRIAQGAEGAYAFAAPNAALPVLGAASKLVGEAIKEKFPDSPGMVAGGEAATLLPILASLRTPKSARDVQRVLKDVGVDRLRQIKTLQDADEATIGVRPLASHYMEPNSPLVSLTKEIATHPAGAAVRAAVNNEKSAANDRIQSFVRSLAGTRTFGQTEANQIAAAGAAAVERPKKALNAATQQLFDQAKREGVPAAEVEALVRQLESIPGTLGVAPTVPAAAAAERAAGMVEGSLRPGSIINPQTKQPFALPVPASNLASVKKFESTAAQKGMQKESDAVAAESVVAQSIAADMINKTARTHSPSLSAAQDIHRDTMRLIVEPHMQSVLTKVFPKEMRDFGQGDFDSFIQVFNGRYSARDIKYLGDRLRLEDPAAMPLIVGFNAEKQLRSAKSPGAFAEKMIGADPKSPQQAEVFKESIVQAALSAGKTPQEAQLAAEGGYRWMETIRRMEQGQSRIAGATKTEAAEIAKTNLGTRLLDLVNPQTWYFRAFKLSSPYGKFLQDRVFRQIANTLTTREGMDRLIEIAQYDPNVNAAKILGRAMVGLRLEED